MSEFIDLCFTPPAWIFTLMMIPVGFYWLLSIFGSVAGHFAEGVDAVDASAAADGAGHSLDGFHGDVDVGDADFDAGGDIHDVHDGHDGHAGHGHGDGDMAHGEAHTSWGGISIGEVPKTLSLSMLVFFGWSSSLAALYFYPPLADIAGRAMWIGAGLSAIAFGLAFGATALAVRPINKLLMAGAGPTRSDLVGKLCTIRTQRVDAVFGQAEVDRASSVVQVRDPLGRGFRYGQRAVIYDYDSDKEVFLIAPFDQENMKIEIPGREAATPAAPEKASEKSPAARRGEQA